MSVLKQVKVDNWGIYFLQRLKHFFNRTDYCDLTLQFQDNAQLKVHRLVLNACTEYFELLERTCEMYEDCLIMPDDLQADVVVPIINFMYTGQLEFKPDLLEKLYQTSQIMNMPVLSKLLLAQKQQGHNTQQRPNILNNLSKRSFHKAFSESTTSPSRDKTQQRKIYIPPNKIAITHQEIITQRKKTSPISRTVAKPPMGKTSVARTHMKTPGAHPASMNIYDRPMVSERKRMPPKELDPRPTRYEVPEELADNIYDDSFSHLSYESKPLMVHPETSKRYGVKKPRFGIFSDASISKFSNDNATIDVIECCKFPQKDNILEHDPQTDPLMFGSTQKEDKKNSSQLFDQILENNESNGPKITIESKDSKEAANIDHAKIISEVLKKYPHLVKGNKNIKLKILDTKPKVEKKQVTKKTASLPNYSDLKIKTEKMEEDYTYETEVIDSKEAARLISLGAENVKGPWICLICGTPGRALHFATYHQFRRHLVDVHNEKILPNICEYCGIKSNKRNHLYYHLLTKHGVPPPSNVKFPKCNSCNYVALTEALLTKHKNTHDLEKLLRCNICFKGFQGSAQLLQHIQETGHKIKFSSDKRSMLRCIYCLKEFIKENNLYAHLVTLHKDMALRDGIIEGSEGSDDERSLKGEQSGEYATVEDETKEFKFEIQQNSNEKPQINNNSNVLGKQRILNAGYEDDSKRNTLKNKTSTINNTFDDTDFMGEEIEVILPDSNVNEEVLMANVEFEQQTQSENEFFVEIKPQVIQPNVQATKAVKKSTSIGQDLQIVVSSAQELKTLIGADHPIIFDQEGNSSKTLAVLTTPQCSSLNTGTEIEMGSNNPNEVMIMSDQYSLNVSEAVSTSNSNIVVLYSDDIDQNKQYIMDPSFAQGQLVTAEGFVQSAVITPNYSTVPTSVISQDMAEPQAETWQGVEQCTESQDTQMDTNETIDTTDDQSVIVTAMPSNNSEEMINHSIITGEQEITNIELSEQINAENNAILPIGNQQEQLEESTQEPTKTMEVDEHNEDIGADESAIISNEEVEQNVTSAEEVIETPNPNPEQEDELEIDKASAQNSQEPEITEEININNDISLKESDENRLTEDNELNTGPVDAEVPPETEKQIANLTSEWSEDEDEKNNKDEKLIESDKSADIQLTKVAEEDVEESIENIQEEVNKQEDLKAVEENDDDNDKEIDSENTDVALNQQESKTEANETIADVINETVNNDSVEHAPKPQVISSLLNDWNENDSQEDSGGNQSQEENGDNDSQGQIEDKGENGDCGDAKTVAETGAVSEAPADLEPKLQKADNIRTLVSDWDEDDEDSKA